MIELANDDKDFDQYEKQAMLAVENKARIDFQSKFLDCLASSLGIKSWHQVFGTLNLMTNELLCI